MRRAAYLFLLVTAACGDSAEDFHDAGPAADAVGTRDAGADAGAMQCETWGNERGDEPCANAIASDGDLQRLGLNGAIKFIVPEGQEHLDAPVFLNHQLFDTHLCFISAFFPDLAGVVPCGPDVAYDLTVVDPLFHLEERRFSVGYIDEYEPGRFGFEVRIDPGIADLRGAIVDIYNALQPRFALGRLDFLTGFDDARTWEDLPFEVIEPDEGYVAYSLGRGCGFVRIFDPAELARAEEEGLLSVRDFVVLESAPIDLAPVVSGIVTATRQGALSHLSVRSAARGTPNAFSIHALERFADFAGELVCVDVEEDHYRIEPATMAEAEAFWQSIRPPPVSIVSANTQDTTIALLHDLATGTAEERREALARYGAKGTNLATLYRVADAYDGYRGVLLPAAFYARFIDEGEWNVDLGEGMARHTFAETLSAWNGDAALLSDPMRLRTSLLALQAAMEEAPIPAGIVPAVHAAIEAAYGDDTTEVRFRSSSNAEDALGFSGAGLYDSTSVCAADSVDDDEAGPSLCNGGRDEERTIERGLRRVWASLWNLRAVLERDWYGIAAADVSMSILVNDRSADEQANVVAFSQNPIDGSDDLLLTSQVGDVDLVRPEPGVRPETLRLVRQGPRVGRVERVTFSTEGDGVVLTEDQARAIGDFLIMMEDAFPIDDEVPTGRLLMLDTEWKVLADGTLVIKQVRPFLR